jgi:hypothetical protein
VRTSSPTTPPDTRNRVVTADGIPGPGEDARAQQLFPEPVTAAVGDGRHP